MSNEKGRLFVAPWIEKFKSHRITLTPPVFRFSLSFRDVEEMLAMRGVALGFETVLEWCLSLARPTPMACCVAGLLGQATAGISMKCSSRSMDASITVGEQWIKMATY